MIFYDFLGLDEFGWTVIFDDCLVFCFWHLWFDFVWQKIGMGQWVPVPIFSAPGSDAAGAVLPSSPPRQRRLWPQSRIYPGSPNFFLPKSATTKPSNSTMVGPGGLTCFFFWHCHNHLNLDVPCIQSTPMPCCPKIGFLLSNWVYNQLIHGSTSS